MMNKYIAPWYLLENYQDYRRIRLAVAGAAAVDVVGVLSIGNEVTSIVVVLSPHMSTELMIRY